MSAVLSLLGYAVLIMDHRRVPSYSPLIAPVEIYGGRVSSPCPLKNTAAYGAKAGVEGPNEAFGQSKLPAGGSLYAPEL